MITSAPSFTTEGSGDGVRRIRTQLSRHYQRKQMECKGVVVFIQTILIIRHRFRWEFSHMDLLRHCPSPSVRRILEELPESLNETYERGISEGRIKATLFDCYNVSWWLFAPFESRSLRRSSHLTSKQKGRDPEAESKLAVGGSRRSGDVGMPV